MLLALLLAMTVSRDHKSSDVVGLVPEMNVTVGHQVLLDEMTIRVSALANRARLSKPLLGTMPRDFVGVPVMLLLLFVTLAKDLSTERVFDRPGFSVGTKLRLDVVERYEGHHHDH